VNFVKMEILIRKGCPALHFLSFHFFLLIDFMFIPSNISSFISFIVSHRNRWILLKCHFLYKKVVIFTLILIFLPLFFTYSIIWWFVTFVIRFLIISRITQLKLYIFSLRISCLLSMLIVYDRYIYVPLELFFYYKKKGQFKYVGQCKMALGLQNSLFSHYSIISRIIDNY